MKISVIVPVYNSEKYIKKLVESVFNQTYQDYELILVNDGSTDNSLKILKELEKKDSRIKVYDEKNSGPGLARKYGFLKSTGDLLYFIDSDDWITHDTDLERIVSKFEKEKIDVLFFNREDIEGNDKSIIKGFDNMKPGIYNISELDDIVRPGLGSKILKKDILSADMFIDSNIYEDLYTTYLYLDKCHNFEYEDETYYSIYHDGKGSSLSYDINSKKINKSLEILIYLYNNLKEESLKKSLLYRASVLYFSYMVRKVKHKDGYTSNEFNKLIKELGIILKNNKIEFYIDNKLKKVIYRIFLKVYARK